MNEPRLKLTRYGGAQINGDLPEILLTRLVMTCLSCPAQWEGDILGGGRFYARARHSRFTVKLNDQRVLAFDLYSEVVEQILGYPLPPLMDEPTTAEMLRLAGAELVPENEPA